jgi:hypothetical protein
VNKKPSSSDLFDVLKRHGIENPVAYRMLASIDTDPDEDILEGFWNLVMPSITYNRLFTSPFPKPSNEVNGELIFAITENNKPVGINLNEVHTLIVGSSNSGKTVCQEILNLKAMQLGCKVWMFVKADDVTRMLRIYREILYVNFKGSFRINPLFFLTKEIFTTIFKDAFVLFEGSEGYLIDSIGELRRKNPNMNLYDLFFFIRAKKHPGLSRTCRYKESILNRLEGILDSPLGKTFDCIRGHESDIVKSSVIFNIAELTLPEQKFIVNSLITLLYFYNTRR